MFDAKKLVYLDIPEQLMLYGENATKFIKERFIDNPPICEETVNLDNNGTSNSIDGETGTSGTGKNKNKTEVSGSGKDNNKTEELGSGKDNTETEGSGSGEDNNRTENPRSGEDDNETEGLGSDGNNNTTEESGSGEDNDMPEGSGFGEDDKGRFFSESACEIWNQYIKVP